jgi:lipoate-protein ligase A
MMDADLLRIMRPGSEPLLHLYDWEANALTFGHFVDPAKYLRETALTAHHFQAARRPTGGGILFHTCDLAFSAFLPSGHSAYSTNTLESYALINNVVLEAVERFTSEKNTVLLDHQPLPLNHSAKHFCMAHPTRYDIMWGGLKVGGAAQRRTKNGILHQGSVCLTVVSDKVLSDILIPAEEVMQGMKANSFPLLGASPSQAELWDARCYLRNLLAECFQKIGE